MKKRFNDTGTCFPDRHYMVDISSKLEKVADMVELGEYFVINRPRQYGKTTTLELLKKRLINRGYVVIFISFEEIGHTIFEDENRFSKEFIEIISEKLNKTNPLIAEILRKRVTQIEDLRGVSRALTDMVNEINEKVVLIIDEIDKSLNNSLFMSFLGMLRGKYLKRDEEGEGTFHSIVLSGIHDIKTLKLKLRPDEEIKYNSPWNIAADFKIDLSFSKEEIDTMMIQYKNETGKLMDTEEIAEKLYFFTNGYPYFVSKLCKIIDEELSPEKWKESDIIEAVKILLLSESNANFDTLTKNLENNKELYEMVKRIVFGNAEIGYEPSVPIINIGIINGIFSKTVNNKVKIHNKIYEEKITNYMTGKAETENRGFNTIQNIFLKPNGYLDMKKVITKFQEVIQEKYSNSKLMKSEEFLENDLRLLFLVFLKPILNGIGFSFKEVQTSAEKRLDVVVIFRDEKFVVEMKMWHGAEYHKQGIEQLKGYIEREHLNMGYMIVMSKNEEKEFKQSEEEGIFTVWM